MPTVKNVGEPCAGEPHARFDGGREETNVSRPRRATPGASRLPDQPLGVYLAFVAVNAKPVAEPFELDYRQLKGHLGLDHYEGRSYLGFHHHCTLVTAAHGFLTLERADPNHQRRA
jgi:hypothetical protein